MEEEGEKRYCGRVPLRMATMLSTFCRMRQRVLRHVVMVGVRGFFSTLQKSSKLGLVGDERRVYLELFFGSRGRV